jgi:retron-type reverse transcriptase
MLQRAVAMVLEAVYEQDFRDCSYGFRPKRSPHQALDAFRQQTMKMLCRSRTFLSFIFNKIDIA